MILATWSFWSKPYASFHHNAWMSEKHHLLSWILSVGTAQQYYRDTLLVTDNIGAQLLVNDLGLGFRNVSLELNKLEEADPHWWTLGKLYTYMSQQQPFIHIDNDVFLWKRLPLELSRSPVFAQNPERFTFGEGAYRPDLWEEAVRAVDGELPSEWTWYTHRRGSEAVCCGIVGGCDNEFMAYYADRAIHMVQNAQNKRALVTSTEKLGFNILVEQYFLSACVNYHRLCPQSPFFGIDIKYLFATEEEMTINAERAGYTHLIAGSKRNVGIAERLERRVRQDYPDEYQKLTRYLG